MSKTGWDNNLDLRHHFLLYSIAGHNNTAIKITNTYSDDQLVIYIFKRQTQQKQWMWATISFKRDRSNSAKERIGDEEQTGGPSLLRREAYLGHERLVSWENMHRTMEREKRKEVLPYSSIPESLASSLSFLVYFGVLGTSAEERTLHEVNSSSWGVTWATVLRFEFWVTVLQR